MAPLCNADLPPPPEGLEIILREQWGADPPEYELQLFNLPVKNIRLCTTKTPLCDGLDRCSGYLKKFQKKFIDIGFGDIPYNFVIDQTGRVYEGRGWFSNTRREEAQESDVFRRHWYHIAYFGGWNKKTQPPEKMSQTADLLIAYGVSAGMIHRQYKKVNYYDY